MLDKSWQRDIDLSMRRSMMGLDDERNPFEMTPEEEAESEARERASQEERVNELLPKFMPVLQAALDAHTPFAITWGEALGRTLLTWMDDLRYDPYGNLESLEQHAALFAKAMAHFVRDAEGRFVWRPGIAMISQAVLTEMDQRADATLLDPA